MITTINEFKKYINESNDGFQFINLLDNKYAEEHRKSFEEFKTKIKGFKTTDGKYSIGDVIEFTAGYNNDIRYTTEILGFDEDNEIYLLWDSYWFPIKDDEKRNIKIKTTNKK